MDNYNKVLVNCMTVHVIYLLCTHMHTYAYIHMHTHMHSFECQSDFWQNSSNSAQLLAHATVVMLKLKIHANMHSNVFAPLPTPGEMYMCTKCAWLNICNVNVDICTQVGMVPTHTKI